MLSLSPLVKSALTPHAAAVIVGDEVTARCGPGRARGRKGDGHFHVCRTALNTHSLGCVSEPLRWRCGRAAAVASIDLRTRV